MTRINVIRTLGDELALATTQVDESSSALRALRADDGAVRETLDALGDGASFDDPFDAALYLANQGNRGLWDGWTSAEAASTILGRAIGKHPGGEGLTELRRAQAIAEQASGDLGNWIANGGRGSTFEALEQVVQRQLDEVRSLAAQVQPTA